MTELLARYGIIPEVARCRGEFAGPISRGDRVVLETHRGPQLGTVIDALLQTSEPVRTATGETPEELTFFDVLRVADAADIARFDELEAEADAAFDTWQQRIADWNLDLQLIDLEWTLNSEKLVLYVLNDRGNECAKLALHAATEGLGVVEVQPVGTEGVVPQPAGGSTGGGCGSGGCGCS